MYNQWDNLHNSDHTASADKYSADRSVQVLNEIQDIMDSRLQNSLDSVTLDKEPPYDEFTVRQLTVWLDQNSWRPYGWKMHPHEARERERET